MIVGRTTLEAEDVAQAFALHPLNRTLRLLALTTATGTGTGLVSIWARERRLEPAAIAGAVVLLACVLLLPWATRVVARIKLAAEPSAQLGIELDSTGCRLANEHGDVTTRWQALEHYRESDSAFLLYATRVMPQILPKRAFDPAEVVRLRALLDASTRRESGPGCTVRGLQLLAGSGVLMLLVTLVQALRM